MANGRPSEHRAHVAAASPSSRVQTRPQQRPDPCEEPCTPRCPACGGLQCACRPRFFPGQLLTDKDLNGLEQYVIDKNRLHNSYLHGWGVACGLEVACDQCDSGNVVVHTGYALSPCGDDIVVCGDQTVDVCALINACESRESVCDDPYDTPPRDCTGGVKKWVLAICYDERPVRGITAQLGASDTPGGCSCGGGCGGKAGCSGGGCASHASCGCGRNGDAQADTCNCAGHETKAAIRGKSYKPQCEPTQVCERYRFMVYPAPMERRLDIPGGQADGNRDLIWAWLFANRSKFGPLIERVLCCVTRAMELRQNIREGVTLDRAFATSAYREYASTVAEFAAEFAIHGCSFVKRTRELRDDAAGFDWNATRYRSAAARAADLSARVTAIDRIWLEIVSECICSALLPPCPKPANTNCVPLAVVTISDDDCRVVDVCNWSERKLLITWPTISYWLSWLPWQRLRKWVLDLCCGSERGGDAYRLLTMLFGSVFSASRTGAAPAVGRASARRTAASAAGTAPADTLAAAFASDNLLTHMLGEFDRVRTDGAEATGQPAWAEVVGRIVDGSILEARAPDDRQLQAVVDRLEAAEKKLRKQATTIAALTKKGGK